MALYSLFERTDRFPKRLILQLDGWMFNPNIKAQFWRDYGSDVERGFRLLGMYDAFSGDLEGTAVWVKQLKDDFSYLASPAVFKSNLAETVRRIKNERSLAALRPTVVMRPINVETDGWASDLSYWYPSMSREAVRQRAERWATDRATAGEQLLDGGFTSLDSKRIELMRVLIKAFQARNVQLFMFLHPFHPVSYNAMNETVARRMHVEAEKVFRVDREGNRRSHFRFIRSIASQFDGGRFRHRCNACPPGRHEAHVRHVRPDRSPEALSSKA